MLVLLISVCVCILCMDSCKRRWLFCALKHFVIFRALYLCICTCIETVFSEINDDDDDDNNRLIIIIITRATASYYTPTAAARYF